MMKRKLLLLTLLMTIAGGAVQSQERPFPQNFKYPYGYLPSTFDSDRYLKWYNRYKADNDLLQSCGNGAIAVGTDEGNAKVEAMGWAMIIAAYMGDKETFDGLYTFYKSKIQNHGMMAWHTRCDGVIDGGSASDGDLDVAFSLLVAHWQWGNEYKDAAKNTINTVKKLITNCSGKSVVIGGYGSDGNTRYGGCNETDISYYTPAFFREFAKFTGDDDWNRLADDTYTVLDNAANDKTGLVPNWHTFSGGQSSKGQYYYGFDACRVPWRIALDYLWNGNEKAKKWCTKLSDWANEQGPRNIKDGYDLDGSVRGENHNMSYLGGFAVAAMCNSQEVADAFGSAMRYMSFDSFWYHAFLGNCYMLAVTGNMWNMEINESALRREHATTSHRCITVINRPNRNLQIAGLQHHSTVELATLNGRSLQRTLAGTSSAVSFDVSSFGSGCYLVNVYAADGTHQTSQVLPLY